MFSVLTLILKTNNSADKYWASDNQTFLMYKTIGLLAGGQSTLSRPQGSLEWTQVLVQYQSIWFRYFIGKINVRIRILFLISSGSYHTVFVLDRTSTRNQGTNIFQLGYIKDFFHKSQLLQPLIPGKAPTFLCPGWPNLSSSTAAISRRSVGPPPPLAAPRPPPVKNRYKKSLRRIWGFYMEP